MDLTKPWRISLHGVSTFQENYILFNTHASHVSRQTPNFLFTNVFFSLSFSFNKCSSQSPINLLAILYSLLASVLGVEPLFTIYRAFTNDSVTQTDFVVVSLSPFWPQNYKCETFVTFWFLSQASFHCLFFFHCVAVLSERYFSGKKLIAFWNKKS